jgi:hypothetical protein
MGHGSGLTIAGVTISAIPLGITVICAWGRVADRTPASATRSPATDPTADAIADGVRDWTVPAATALFTAAYVAVAVVTLRVLSADSVPVCRHPGGRVVRCSCAWSWAAPRSRSAPAGPRSGPRSCRSPCGPAATVCLKVVSTFLLVSAAMFLVALAVDLGAALNVMSELHSDVGEASLYAGLALVVLPNAALVCRQLPAGPGLRRRHGHDRQPDRGRARARARRFPLLAALPDDGAPSPWMALLLLGPTVGGGVRRGSRAPPVPDHALGGRGPSAAAPGASWRAWSSAGWLPWPAAPSDPAGCRTSGRSPPR